MRKPAHAVADDARQQNRQMLLTALKASITVIGPGAFCRELSVDPDALRSEKREPVFDDIVARLLPTDCLEVGRRVAERSMQGEKAYTDNVFEPASLWVAAYATALGWGMDDDEASYLLPCASPSGLISKQTRTRAILIIKIARLLAMVRRDDPALAQDFMTSPDETLERTPLHLLRLSAHPNRVQRVWEALERRVYDHTGEQRRDIQS